MHAASVAAVADTSPRDRVASTLASARAIAGCNAPAYQPQVLTEASIGGGNIFIGKPAPAGISTRALGLAGTRIQPLLEISPFLLVALDEMFLAHAQSAFAQQPIGNPQQLLHTCRTRGTGGDTGDIGQFDATLWCQLAGTLGKRHHRCLFGWQ